MNKKVYLGIACIIASAMLLGLTALMLSGCRSEEDLPGTTGSEQESAFRDPTGEQTDPSDHRDYEQDRENPEQDDTGASGENSTATEPSEKGDSDAGGSVDVTRPSSSAESVIEPTHKNEDPTRPTVTPVPGDKDPTDPKDTEAGKSEETPTTETPPGTTAPANDPETDKSEENPTTEAPPVTTAPTDAPEGTTEATTEETTEPERAQITYEEYLAMSLQERQDYFNTFTTIEEKMAFVQWLNEEEERYKAEQPTAATNPDGSIIWPTP